MGTVSTGNAEHYTWGQGCDGWHLLASSDLSVIEERMPVGTAERRHLHAHARQFFYVLEGELAIELEGETYRLRVREGLHVPPGMAHQVRNDAAVDARMLVVSSPRSHGDRIDAPVEVAT
ncbi:cupin domain-containing protein [Dyella amyloliquefaciens]|uniref:cupin domain-containing protein n=1 Tax=Dyella amyloliquefaciens TaxID=1770545 RepID=UPI00102EBE29|nr:cupin domain-containing protein [Dyella amyloliquefaciens]